MMVPGKVILRTIRTTIWTTAPVPAAAACGGRACGGRACGGRACGGRACGGRACWPPPWRASPCWWQRTVAVARPKQRRRGPTAAVVSLPTTANEGIVLAESGQAGQHRLRRRRIVLISVVGLAVAASVGGLLFATTIKSPAELAAQTAPPPLTQLTT